MITNLINISNFLVIIIIDIITLALDKAILTNRKMCLDYMIFIVTKSTIFIYLTFIVIKNYLLPLYNNFLNNRRFSAIVIAHIHTRIYVYYWTTFVLGLTSNINRTAANRHVWSVYNV